MFYRARSRKMSVTLPVVILLTMAMGGCDASRAPMGRSGDYLTSDLRDRVERLKSEAERERTTQATVKDRVRLLWDWFNALSLTEVQLNPDLPLIVAAVLNPDLDTVGTRMLNAVDMVVNELRARDEHSPEAFGTLATDITGPFVAGTHQTMQTIYVVGDIPVRSGGGILVGRHFQSYRFPDGTNFQTHDPAGEGYITLRTTRSGAVLTADTLPWFGLHGQSEVGTMPVLFRLSGAELVQGDTVTITYGDTAGGSRGVRIQDYSNDAVPLPL